ncbi:MAG: pyruvate formate lyase family protein [Oscillospiraceae bacterium]
MTDYIQDMLTFFVADKKHHQFRTTHPQKYQLAEELPEGTPDYMRAQKRLAWMFENETPVVFPNEKISLLRTVTAVPEIYTPRQWEAIKEINTLHEQGKVCNINPDYARMINTGTTKMRAEIKTQIDHFSARPDKAGYLKSLLLVLDSLEAFAEKYRQEALRAGNQTVADTFARIPKQPPRTLLEALQFLRLMHYGLWCSFNYHNTFGRFDQYMYPYYINDIENGTLDEESALELLEEFFISCNRDSDLYPGMQQGDNGQSMVLGGLNPDGTESYNALSDLCLQASLELKLIDPKINLRVNKNTPIELYNRGSALTRQGLGFPQYSNDDVVIKALKNWGYSNEDACNYIVAACWEFIIPGCGMDIPNINSLSFVHAVNEAIHDPKSWNTFDQLLARVKKAIFTQAQKLMEATQNLYMEPAPLMSLMMDGCIQNAQDISLGGKYNNYGFHGSGLSTAVDSLAAVRQYLFDEPAFTQEQLVEMLDTNFEGQEELLAKLRYQAPKMGNDDDAVDALAKSLLNWFADAVEAHKNDRGGIFRAGTGSAMYYIWHADEEPATPDGRKKGEPLACNYSPSLFSRCRGPISIIKSFAKPDLTRVANGGPLTIELHDNMFRNEDSVYKVAQFVKSFIDMGGHQMQINSVNRDKMLDAQAHPDKYRNLIVRVWGWSGYFVELDEIYQNHIIQRAELNFA